MATFSAMNKLNVHRLKKHSGLSSLRFEIGWKMYVIMRSNERKTILI